MKRISLIAFTAVLLAGLTAPAFGALKVGDKAPLFTLEATRGGEAYPFSLAAELQKGPVVLYFYPAAFTKGCTIEAHDFAVAMPKYRALGATVIGVSHDSLSVLKRFSVSVCRKEFPVAADTNQKVMKEYDAVLASHPKYANRTSYVIAPDDTIIYTYTNLDPSDHVANTLAALREWRARHPQH